MNNITLSIDHEVLREARKVASEQGTTVNALVRAYLTEMVARRQRVHASLARMRKISEQAGMEVGPKTWTRDDVHER